MSRRDWGGLYEKRDRSLELRLRTPEASSELLVLEAGVEFFLEGGRRDGPGSGLVAWVALG